LRPGPFHPFDDGRDLLTSAVLDRPELGDRLAAPGDDHGLAALDRADQAGQMVLAS
jgi:hypothetical protein